MTSSDTFKLISTYLPQSSSMKKSSVCRCLFGRPEREPVQSEMQLERQRQDDADLGVAKLQWGYDFEKDQPMDNGAYEWTALSKQTVPSFYAESLHSKRRKLKASRNPLRRNLLSSSDSDSESTCLSFSAARLRADPKQVTESLRTQITEVSNSEINTDEIKMDITTPCMKQLHKVDLSDAPSDLTKLDSSAALTCAISKADDTTDSETSDSIPTFSGATSSPVQDERKLKKQTSIVDFLKVRKRKASYSISGNKRLRRLW